MPRGNTNYEADKNLITGGQKMEEYITTGWTKNGKVSLSD